MSSFFVDTSALGKRYVIEKGSAWVRSWIDSNTGNMVIVSDLTSVEAISIFARLRREGQITPIRHARLQAVFLWHFEHQYLAVPIDSSILAQARLLLNRYPLRALDALQLASAQHAMTVLGETLIFVTSDKLLLNAADGEGFAIDNPNEHP